MNIEVSVREDLNSSCAMISIKRNSISVVALNFDLANERNLEC